MKTILGAIRFLSFVCLLLIGLCLILLSIPFSFRIGGAKIANYIVKGMSKVAFWIFGIRLSCPDMAKLKQHRGLVISNHISYLDILALCAITPIRFLSNHAVRSYPLIGWIAVAVETVFVNRENKQSREAARQQMAREVSQNPYPPLALFPEGTINNADIRTFLPFQLGAFRITQDGNISLLPCVLSYHPLPTMRWLSDTESLYTAAWRLATHIGKKTITLHVLDTISITQAEDFADFAHKIQEKMQAHIL